MFIKRRFGTVLQATDGDNMCAHGAASVLRRRHVHRFRQGFRPKLFEIVKIPDFRSKEMDDYVTAVDQDPIAVLQAFDRDAFDARRFQLLAKVICHRSYLPDACAAGNNHGVGNTAFAGEIDRNDIDRFVVIERLLNQFEKLLGRRQARGVRSYDTVLAMRCIHSPINSH